LVYAAAPAANVLPFPDWLEEWLEPDAEVPVAESTVLSLLAFIRRLTKPAEQEKAHLWACMQETGREVYVRSGPRAELEAERDTKNAEGGDYFIRPAESSQQAPSTAAQERLIVEVFHQQGDVPFICAVHGKTTVAALCGIEDELRGEDTPVSEAGTYRFAASWNKAQVDEMGRIEFPAYWELDQIGFDALAHKGAQGDKK
jgi:hypothetical protein